MPANSMLAPGAYLQHQVTKQIYIATPLLSEHAELVPFIVEAPDDRRLDSIILSLNKRDQSLFTITGEPRTGVLSQRLGEPVSRQQRDAALRRIAVGVDDD